MRLPALVALLASSCAGSQPAGPGPSPAPSPTATTPAPSPSPTPASAGPDCRPVGRWTVSLSPTTGTCALGSFTDLLTVTSGQGYSVNGYPATVASSGGRCVLANQEPYTLLASSGNALAGDQVQVSRDYTLDLSGTIGGSGSWHDQTHPCDQNFSAGGSGP